MKILSWNVNGRVEDAARRQLRAVLRRRADVICLQEVTGRPGGGRPGSYPIWSEGLLREGFSVASSIDLVALPYPEPPYQSPPFPRPRGSEYRRPVRRYFNLIAATHPICALPGLSYPNEHAAAYAFPEKFAAARVRLGKIEIDVHNTHVPPGVSVGLLKVDHFQAVRRRVDRDRSRPRILCGDFNAPVEENLEGPLFDVDEAWGEPWSRDDKLRWRDAEWSLLNNDEMPDAYLAFPRRRLPASHFTGRSPNRTPHRYDHIFASTELKPQSCNYLTGWLDRGLSDHAAVEAEYGVPDVKG